MHPPAGSGSRCCLAVSQMLALFHFATLAAGSAAAPVSASRIGPVPARFTISPSRMPFFSDRLSTAALLLFSEAGGLATCGPGNFTEVLQAHKLTRVAIPRASLSGNGSLEYTCSCASSSATALVVVVPPRADVLQVDNERGMFVLGDGTPVLPAGFYSSSGDATFADPAGDTDGFAKLQLEAPMGWTHITFLLSAPTLPYDWNSTRAYFEEAARVGVRVLYDVREIVKSKSPGKWEQLSYVASTVATFPALGGFTIADEPRSTIDSATMSRAYLALKSAAPHVLVQLDLWGMQFYMAGVPSSKHTDPAWFACADYFATDPYIVSQVGLSAGNTSMALPLSTFGDVVDRAKSWAHGSKALAM